MQLHFDLGRLKFQVAWVYLKLLYCHSRMFLAGILCCVQEIPAEFYRNDGICCPVSRQKLR